MFGKTGIMDLDFIASVRNWCWRRE